MVHRFVCDEEEPSHYDYFLTSAARSEYLIDSAGFRHSPSHTLRKSFDDFVSHVEDQMLPYFDWPGEFFNLATSKVQWGEVQQEKQLNS